MPKSSSAHEANFKNRECRNAPIECRNVFPNRTVHTSFQECSNQTDYRLECLGKMSFLGFRTSTFSISVRNFFFPVRNFWVHHSTVRNKKNHSGAPFSVIFSHLSSTRKRKRNWMRTSRRGEKSPQTQHKKFRTTCGLRTCSCGIPKWKSPNTLFYKSWAPCEQIYVVTYVHELIWRPSVA